MRRHENMAGTERRGQKLNATRAVVRHTILSNISFSADIQAVHFESADHQAKLVGYLFAPSGGGRHAAVVMLHGRAGPYSSLAKGVYNETTLSKRHKEWGQFWADRGYIALLVDSFGPRG